MKQILSIDLGSVSISVLTLDLKGRIISREYVLHYGDPKKVLDALLREKDPAMIAGIASPSRKIGYAGDVQIYDLQVSLMKAVKVLGLEARSILHVGAERFFLLEMDDRGRYRQTSHSSSCAAGTGSFLDQQAVRLKLKDTAALSDLALSNRESIPDIAARCSVFAKTDLIHAQQKGYPLEAICDSLCKGLADNLVSTLFSKADPVEPLVMSGGVALNGAVVKHLEDMLGLDILIHEHAQHLPAIGAASLLREDLDQGKVKPGISGLSEIGGWDQGEKQYHFDALVPPAEGGGGRGRAFRQKEYRPRKVAHPSVVQVDIFDEWDSADKFYMGIDVGSTSTKAVLINGAGKPVAGFYTYTLGQPLKATQAIMEAADREWGGKEPDILACGTTGSGRKFIGAIVGADQDVDEITAHARAAYELNPLTDTIIEIGGQDAKFTQMKEGVVTFSQMNTVCAAGTGSFIEELAARLGVRLEDLQDLAMGRKAPLASDRCTVFMERDINQLLSQGYKVEEVLATVIHSVRENYLKKVASEAHIGGHVCFQGATARNQALVAAFEQRLAKDIFVSPLCHLTGALGTALLIREEFSGKTSFRGLDLFRRDIPVHTERCDLCLNKCTISVAGINSEKVAYGFLCGRDYETDQYVRKHLQVPDIIKLRKKLEKELAGHPGSIEGKSVVGLPSVLHMVEDHFFWKQFFAELGIPVTSSDNFRDGLKRGKGMAGAEFCAPIDTMFGHVNYLAGSCSEVFFPIYLEAHSRTGEREENLCYYTQYSTALAHLEQWRAEGRVHSPMLNFRKGSMYNAGILASTLADMGVQDLDTGRVRKALEMAGVVSELMKDRLKIIMKEQERPGSGVSVVLLGRPYVLLSESMNKGIPGIISSLGSPAFFQDMLDLPAAGSDAALEQLLEKIPWHYAAHILRATDQVCRTPGLYPVLVTAFKCAPDSFIISYFEQIMNLYGKPYLIIQIDEHDSNTGYETRIEAALRSFRNHLNRDGAGSQARQFPSVSLLPKVERRIGKRTLLLPNWDMDVSPLVVANLRRAGYDARLLQSSEMGIRRSMVHNTGQCLPINIIAQDYMDFIRLNDLKPANCILWMMESHLTCNLRQYPYYIKRILESHGRGMEKAAVYSGELTHRELSLDVTYYAYFAYMLGGLFRKVACRIRPYEQEPGATDRAYARVKEVLVSAISGKKNLDDAVREGVEHFREVAFDRESRKPLVAIFGDFYVRDNEIMNQDLVRDIERAGGEVLTTPFHEFTQLSIENIFRRAVQQRGERVKTAFNRVLFNVLKYVDDRYYRYFEEFLGPAPEIHARILEQRLKDFGVDLMHSGESYDNLLKIFFIMEKHPGISLFVQTNPAFCCPALVTEAMTRRIREQTGVPIVTLTYDGTSDRRNEVIVPYIQGAALTGSRI